MDTFLTIPDVARMLQVSEKTVSRMLQDGTIPGFKVANQWRFHPVDFEEWLGAKRSGRGVAAKARIAEFLGSGGNAVPLSRLTDEGLIVVGLPAGGKESVLRAMAAPLAERKIVADIDGFVAGLLDRERMMTTGIGGGIALPHLRNPERRPVERPLVVVGTSKDGIDWDSIDQEPARAFFLPVAGDEVVHLRILSAIRSSLTAEGAVDEVAGAETPREVISALLKYETLS